MDWVTQSTAEANPKVNTVPLTSLSIVFGTPTMGIPCSYSCCAIASEPSPPMDTRASRPRAAMPLFVSAISSSGSRRSWPCPVFAREPPAVRGAENRAAAHQQAVERLVVQQSRSRRLEQAVVAAEDPEGLPPAPVRRLRDGTNDRVQAGAVSPTRHHADSLDHGRPRKGSGRPRPDDYTQAGRLRHTEVRNPLSSISLNLELLEEEFRDCGCARGPVVRQLVGSVQNEAARLKHLTDEYLAFSRPRHPVARCSRT